MDQFGAAGPPAGARISAGRILLPDRSLPQAASLPDAPNDLQLREIVADLGEGVLMVAPGGTILWANGAALAMHGVADAGQLGSHTRDYRRRFRLRYRNNHRLARGKYPLERIAARETFSGVVVEVRPAGRDGAPWVHEARGKVIAGGAGGPDCLVLFLIDRTNEANAEQRFERAFNANPAPALICRLSDLRHTRANPGFLSMTGYTAEDVVGRSAYDLDLLEDAPDKPAAVAALRAGHTIPQTEATLRLPDGGRKFVIVAGQPIEIGRDPCMLFTFIDLDRRKQAEAELRQSKERIDRAFDLSPLPSTVSTLADGRIQEANAAFLALVGYSAEGVAGRTPAELRIWEDDSRYRQFLQALRRQGGQTNQDIRVRTADGAVLECLLSGHTFSSNGATCVLSVLQDVTERRRTEAELIAALDQVMQDTSWFSRTVIEKLALLRRPGPPADRASELADLTRRERAVLGLMSDALDDRAIAAELRLSPNTVRNHVGSIYRKLDVHSRGAAIVWARDRGISGRPPAPPRAAGRAGSAPSAGAAPPAARSRR